MRYLVQPALVLGTVGLLATAIGPVVIKAAFSCWCVFTLVFWWHESGHLIAMLALRLRAKEIQIGLAQFAAFSIGDVRYRLGLLPFAGWVRYVDETEATPRQRLIVAAAGPLASIVLGLLLLLLESATVPSQIMHNAAMGSIIGIALFNLLPLRPFDGAEVFEAALRALRVPLSSQAAILSKRAGMAVIGITAAWPLLRPMFGA